ncbi:MAG: alpha/beta hydrolase [Gammaproteobacteria bacterium]
MRRGRPVLYFHGLPGSRREALLVDPPARKAGARLIAAERPGYGRSTFQPRRRLNDWPCDIEQLADALKLERFAVLGVSGGGPYALACARALPDRVTSAGVVCGLGPLTDRALRGSMRWLPRTALYLAEKAPLLLDAVYGQPLTWLTRAGSSLPLRLLAYRLGEPDRSVMLRPDTLAALMQSLREAFRQGPGGAREDARILGGQWGFRLHDIRTRVHLWHGDADIIVPPLHARYLDASLPRSQLALVAGEGHFSLPIKHRLEILEIILRADAW